MSPGFPIIVKNRSARKSLRLLTEVLVIKNNSVQRLGAAKSKRKAIIAGVMLWSSIPKRKVHTKINSKVKKYVLNWIIQHPQVVKYAIVNDCFTNCIDGATDPQLVT